MTPKQKPKAILTLRNLAAKYAGEIYFNHNETRKENIGLTHEEIKKKGEEEYLLQSK